MTTTTTRAIYEIANDIIADFVKAGKPIPFGAKPYIEAMTSLVAPSDNYGCDSAKSGVLYALSNLSGWRGDTARAVKAELKALIKGY